VAEEGVFSGTMERVSGEMFDQDSDVPLVANTFRGDHAVALKETQALVVTGNITMISKEQGVTINCDKVEWLAKEKIVKASGNVRIHGTYGEMSGLNEVWASPDFKHVATPGMFKQP
jgi:lipopolysaccharide assembly outer membrane protein LptD (OstA)